MEPRSGPSRPIRMTRTPMLTVAAAGMLLAGCGQQPSAPPTQAAEALAGCTQTQSKAAARHAREVPAEVDLDGDGSPDKVLITRDDAACTGVLFTTAAFQGSFQLLPLYLRFGESLPTLEAFGGIVLLLVWLYVLCNVFLLGAEINWWYGRGRHRAADAGLGLA